MEEEEEEGKRGEEGEEQRVLEGGDFRVMICNGRYFNYSIYFNHLLWFFHLVGDPSASALLLHGCP